MRREVTEIGLIVAAFISGAGIGGFITACYVGWPSLKIGKE